MKNLFRHLAWYALLLVTCLQCTKQGAPLSGSSSSLATQGFPAKYQLFISSLWISTSADCRTGLTPLAMKDFNFDLATQVMKFTAADANPALSYHCLVIKAKDTLTWAARENTGACVKGAVQTDDLCPSGSESVSPEGTRTPCTSGIDDIFLYFSDETPSGAAPSRLKLTAPIELALSASNSGLLYIDLSQVVQASERECRAPFQPTGRFDPDL